MSGKNGANFFFDPFEAMADVADGSFLEFLDEPTEGVTSNGPNGSGNAVRGTESGNSGSTAVKPKPPKLADTFGVASKAKGKKADDTGAEGRSAPKENGAASESNGGSGADESEKTSE